jgi:Phosphotransferase system, galactitol-specific IIB component
MPQKVILVSCGTGVVTAETTALRIRKIAAERKWPVEVRVVEFPKLKQAAAGADVIVQIAPHDAEDYGIPKLSGLPFLTGFELEKTVQQLEAILLTLDKPKAEPKAEPPQNGL